MKNNFYIPSGRKELFILALITAIAVCLRLFKLTGYGFQYEEIYSFVFPDLFRYSLNFSSAQPTYLYNFFMHYLQAWTSNEWVLRMPSVLWGAASVPCVYLLGKKVSGDGLSGLFAAFLLAVSPFHVYFSQELRMYPLVAFLGVVSAYFFISSFDRRSVAAWCAVVFCNTLNCYLSYTAILLVGAQLVCAVIYRKKFRERKKEILWVLFWQGILLIPWMYIFYRQFLFMLELTKSDRRVCPFLDTVGVNNLWYTIKNFSSGFCLPGVLRLIMGVVMSALCLRYIRILYAVSREKLGTVIIFILFPLFFLLCFSQFRPLYCDKYVITGALFFYVLAGCSLRRLSVRPRIFLMVLIFCVWAGSLACYYTNSFFSSYRERIGITPRKEFYKAGEYLKKFYRPGDVIIQTCTASTLPIAYYMSDGKNEEFLKRKDLILFQRDISHMEKQGFRMIIYDPERREFSLYKATDSFLSRFADPGLARFQRVWVVYSYWEYPQVIEGVRDRFNGLCRLEEKHEFKGLDLYVYNSCI